MGWGTRIHAGPHRSPDQGRDDGRVFGTSCWFDWGVWLSPASFALAGGQEADDFGQWIQGTLQIYSLSDSTVATYVTRIVSREEYGRYRQAWERWLRARYRSLRASRPRT